MKKIELFSDGSCLKNPGNGGWAYIIRFGDKIKKQSGGEAYTTNNKMELKAVINGLSALKEPCEVDLFTDSQYVQKGLDEWLKLWVAKNFKEVKNKELWRELLELSKKHKINAHWIKGHAGHEQNEECDAMAHAAAEKIALNSHNFANSNVDLDTTSANSHLNSDTQIRKRRSEAHDEKIAEFERILGYEFRDENLIREALTHKSVKAGYSNERLEFLGDAVLDLVVGEYLYKKIRGTNNEGNLSKLRAALVNEFSFAKISELLHIGEFLFLSLAEEKNGGRNKPSLVSDALEAVMGAVYLEAGLEKVKGIFINLLEKEYDKINLETLGKDYKTTLQEITQARFALIPRYELISSSGPDHKKTFEMALFLGEEERARAKGASKKEAEQKAAAAVLKELGEIIGGENE